MTTAPEFKAPDGEVGHHRRAAAAGRTVRVASALVQEDGDTTEPVAGFTPENSNHYRKFGWLSLSEMVIDPRVQRPEVPTQINKIAREFNENALGTATVSARFDQVTGKYTYIVLDGQQRRGGALKHGFTGNIRVDMHFNLTLADEATLFRILNERRGVQPIELFRIALVEGNTHALAVKKILDDLGIPFGTPKGYSGAKSSLRLVARRNGETILRWALVQVQKIYDNEGKGGCYDAGVVEAFYWLFDRYGSRIDEDNLYIKLSSKGGGTADLIGHAKTTQTVRGGRLALNLIRAIIARYNQDKRSAKTRLPDWTIEAPSAEVEEVGATS